MPTTVHKYDSLVETKQKRRKVHYAQSFCCVIITILLALQCLFFIGIRREEHFVRLANTTLSNYQTNSVCVRSDISTNATSSTNYNSTQDPLALPTPCSTNFVTMEKRTYEYEASLTNSSSLDIAHCGECGKCSTDDDIELMIRTKDTLTKDATKCALRGLLFGDHSMEKCLRTIGFTSGCSTCWKENIKCTTSNCKYTCLKYKYLSEPNNNEEGGLNSCLECDEKMCGPQFIKCAGCNRRRLGIISDIGRDDQEQCNITEMDENINY